MDEIVAKFQEFFIKNSVIILLILGLLIIALTFVDERMTLIKFK